MSGSVNQTVIQNSFYLISRNGIYFSRRVPADLHKRFNKDRVILSLRTRSQNKAFRSAQILRDAGASYIITYVTKLPKLISEING